MNRPMISLILLTAALSFRLPAVTTLHVSTDGDNNQPGTQDKPLRTIEKARVIVRSLVKQENRQDVTIYLHQGTYYLEAPLNFYPEDGGTENYRVTYQAYGNENVVISGGRVLNDWQQAAGGRWITRLSEGHKVRELFVNGRRAQRARYPDSGYLRAVDAAADRMSYFSLRAGELPEQIASDQTELVFIHDWSISRLPVAKVDLIDNRLYPLVKIGRQHPMMVIDGYEPHPRYFLENDSSFCDTGGEWCQLSDGRLVYLPLPGEKIDATEIVIPVLDKLLLIQGDETEDKYVQNLEFKGLIFEHCRFDLPAEGYAGVQATFYRVEDGTGFEKGWRGFVPAAIELTMAKNCRFEAVTIRHTGGAGIMLGSRTFYCTLSGSALYDISGNGVMAGESRDRFIEDETWWKAAPEQAATGHLIENCLIERCGIQYSGAVGIWVGLARQIRIQGNELRSLPYTGISIGWMWNPQPTPCMGNIVQDNHIHHVMQELSDGGGIYTLGFQPGTILSGNLIHDIPLNAGRAESNGMFLDEGTTDIKINRNAFFHTARSPLRFHRARRNQVSENLFVLPAGMPVIRYNRTPEKNILLKNNQIAISDELDEEQVSQLLQPWIKKSGGGQPGRSQSINE